jgi:hypothetical protein
MLALIQALLILGLNAIPVGGVILQHWSPSTALTLYWCENLLGTLLVTLRIAQHARRTRKRGHCRIQINQNSITQSHLTSDLFTFTREFALLGFVFTLAHGFFLALVFLLVLKSPPSWNEIHQGLRYMIPIQIAGFLVDLPQLGSWSFAQLKRRSASILGRIVLIHLAIIGGMFIAAFSSRPHLFFSVFGTLKTLTDLASLLPAPARAPDEAPRWFLTLARILGPAKPGLHSRDPAAWWRESNRAERSREEQDEQFFPPVITPSA